MTPPTLSLCMIVRDEARHLRRALSSVRGLVDEIVILDTGSQDDTVPIALAHGARVASVVWQDDFSLARNHVLERATGRWILSLDADETIAARDHGAIRAAVARSDIDAVRVVQRTYLDYPTAIGWTAGEGGYEEGRGLAGFCDVACCRLFRREPWIRFRQRVHEVIASTDDARPLRMHSDAWVVHHFGKVAPRDVLAKKWDAYVRMGRLKIEAEPSSPQAHYELGIQYLEFDRPEDALPCFQQAHALSHDYRQSLLLIGVCEARLHRHEMAQATLARAADNPTSRIEATVQRASALLELARAGEALDLLRPICAETNVPVGAMVVMAVALKRTGAAADARAWLDRAVLAAPADPQARCERALLRHRSGDTAGALEDVEGAGTSRTARLLRARLLLTQRRFDDARQTLALIGEPGHPEVLVLEGGVALGLGDYERAATLCRASLSARASVEAALNLAVALQAVGDESGAQIALGEGLRLDPDHPALLARHRQLSPVEGRRRRSITAAVRPLTFALWHPRSIAYDADTPRTRGLGGTESAVVYLAEALAARGHRVTVLNNCPADGESRGVIYRRWEEMPAFCAGQAPDVLVAIRHWQTIAANRFAPLQLFWTGDAYDQPFLDGLERLEAPTGIDVFVLQSEWQARTFEEQRGVPATRIVRMPLGTSPRPVDVPALSGPRARRIVYASTPFRGLDRLLDMFPRIRERCDDAELHVFSSMAVYGVDAVADRQQFGHVYAKATQPGVVLAGTVPQPALARALGQSRILAYPNTFAETFCIGAAEAMAAGCPVVTSALGALPETVGDGGVVIAGDPASEAYQATFVDVCVSLLTDDDRWQWLSDRAARRAAERYTWASVAEQWEGVVRQALAGR